MTAPVPAWWFSAEDTLPQGDNRKIVVGKAHTVEPPLELCRRGLHGSKSCLDALGYAQGPWLHRTEHSGEILHDTDKLCSSSRKYLARVDFTPQLRLFARQCAQDVLHLWDAPQVVKDYLATGDESIRQAAQAAARVAARSAARDAARAAVRDAAWDKQAERLEALALEAVREQWKP